MALLRWLKAAWLLFWAPVLTVSFAIPIVSLARLGFARSAWLLVLTWSRLLLLVQGARVETEGREKIVPDRTYVVISNHQSLIDILALVSGLGLQVRFLVKKELRRIPIFGIAVDLMHNIYVDRSNTRAAIESIRRGMQRLRGESLTVFPEGTRSPDGHLLPFRKGAFHIAVDSGRPILPVTINGSGRRLPKRSFAFNPGRIRLVVSDPVPTEGLGADDVPRLLTLTRARIAARLDPAHP
jgi:1-acyl-sn-glycerol-3-phosphate acyltransferase